MIKYIVKPTSRFKKDYKLILKQGKEEARLYKVVRILAEGNTLPATYRDHALTGKFEGCRECHIQPDWLLVYQVVEDELILYLMRTGSHSDLFDM